MPILKDRIAELVARYTGQRTALRRASCPYSELDTRAEFIDPFFEALGWDLANTKGLPQRLREVIRETQVSVDENIKRPDYAFKLGPERRFFIEAKKPKADLEFDAQVAFQVRRYGWSAGLLVSAVTNFEKLIIYDTTTQPSSSDAANNSRLKIFSYDEYVDRLDEIAVFLSRDAVYSGRFDQQFSGQVRNRPEEAIDSVFLQTLNEWRLALGRDIQSREPSIDPQSMNEIVQRFILRVLFLRMCEDRGIQTYEHLKHVGDTNNWPAFVNLLVESDSRFDSELFDIGSDPFCRRGRRSLELNSSTVHSIIETLYFPRAPYTFSVFEPEFLGDIYEQFLVERLNVREGNVVLERKPENVDRDVIQTPRPLIQRIIQETLEPLLTNLSLEAVLRLRIIDPSSGSGGFLIAAFDALIDQVTSAMTAAGMTDAIYQTANGNHLVFEQKIRILQSCLYAVDRDILAVEVTRFSLLTKCLEDESASTLPEGRRILPQLQSHIVWGDSLVDKRIYANVPNPRMISAPLTWGEDIPEPYEVVIGNPPYLNTEAMVNLEPTEYGFYNDHYTSAFKQFDKYYLFIERALTELMGTDGVLGMVVSRKFTNIESGKKLRGLISRGRHLVRLVDFGNAQMFSGRTTYTCLLFLSRAGVSVPENDADDTFDYELVTTPTDWLAGLVGDSSRRIKLPRTLVAGEDAWVLPSTPDELELVLALNRNTVRLEKVADVFNGIQSSRDSVYEITEWADVDDKLISFVKDGRTRRIERDILKPFFDDKYGQLISFHPMPDVARIIFPYFIQTRSDGTPEARVIPPGLMASKFPLAYAWLVENIDDLKKRDIQPDPYPPEEWYRYGRDQALTLFENRPKLVVGVNSLGDKYVYDESNTLLASGGTAGECAIAQFREPSVPSRYDLHFILALLNHKAIEFYCRKRGSPFRGGWFARGTAVLKTVPVPIIDFDDTRQTNQRLKLYKQITQLSKDLSAMHSDMERALSNEARIRLERRATTLKQRIDDQISNLYGISAIISSVVLPT